MSTNREVGSVAGLWRFPVKSMKGERLELAELTEQGLMGDRGYALIESDTGKVVTAKNVKHYPGLMGFEATYLEPPRLGEELPPVRITLPTGTTVTSDSGSIDQVLSAYFHRDVTLARQAPENYTIDQYHPDVEDVHPEGLRDRVVDQKLGSALFTEAGLPSPVPVGSLFDAFPVTVLTSSTLKRLNEIRPQSRFDQRRFRMNIILDTAEPGFLENDWVGHELEIGATARLNVTLNDPRCVMTTLPQDELPQDTDILKTLARHNRIQVGNLGLYPCAGVYAAVVTPGKLRLHDRVKLNKS
jgi:uncharacterized protein